MAVHIGHCAIANSIIDKMHRKDRKTNPFGTVMRKVFIFYILVCSMLLYAGQVRAAQWVFHAETVKGSLYYDKSSIHVNKDIRYIHTKTVYTAAIKKDILPLVQHSANAPKKPELISHAIVLFEIDCSRKLLKDFFTAVYDKNGDAVYCSIKGNAGPWKSIPPDTSEESLEKIACSISSAPIKAKSINNVKTPSIVLETSGHLSALTAFSPDQPKPENTKQQVEAEIRNFITTWLTSWQTGDMETYKSCYLPGFTSRGMNLDAWIAYKTELFRKNKNIDIIISDLQILIRNHQATAVFIQKYRSSLFRDTGKKTLELKKINGRWGIDREKM